jgi:hypothetical protein
VRHVESGTGSSLSVQARRSGVAAAVIVLTTILAYLLSPENFVLSLALMRGGVLVMAPAFDLLHRRAISWGAWSALSCCFCAAVIALTVTAGPGLPLLAWINLAIYWLAYAFRLAALSRWAKQRIVGPRAQWFISEGERCAGLLAAMSAVILCAGIALGGLDGQLIWHALAAASAYGFVFYFGTLIYLDWRENAFAVSLNRAASLLGGLIAALIAWIFLAAGAPSLSSISAAGLVLFGVVALGLDKSHARRSS